MIIKVNGILTFDDINFNKNNLSDEEYEKTIVIARKEIDIINIRHNDIVYKSLDFGYKKSLELINSIMSAKDSASLYNSSVTNLNHRNNFNFDSGIKKQIFINNFLFPENQKFIDVLKNCNITKEQIENLIKAIVMKKKVAKLSKIYDLDIDGIIDFEMVGNYYGFHKYEVIINKIYEIYYKYPELLRILEDTKKR